MVRVVCLISCYVVAFPNESLAADFLQLFYDRAPKTADNFRALCTGNVWCNCPLAPES